MKPPRVQIFVYCPGLGRRGKEPRSHGTPGPARDQRSPHIMECTKTCVVVLVALILSTAGFVLTITAWFAPPLNDFVTNVRVAGPVILVFGFITLILSCVLCSYVQSRCCKCCYKYSHRKQILYLTDERGNSTASVVGGGDIQYHMLCRAQDSFNGGDSGNNSGGCGHMNGQVNIMRNESFRMAPDERVQTNNVPQYYPYPSIYPSGNNPSAPHNQNFTPSPTRVTVTPTSHRNTSSPSQAKKMMMAAYTKQSPAPSPSLSAPSPSLSVKAREIKNKKFWIPKLSAPGHDITTRIGINKQGSALSAQQPSPKQYTYYKDEREQKEPDIEADEHTRVQAGAGALTQRVVPLESPLAPLLSPPRAIVSPPPPSLSASPAPLSPPPIPPLPQATAIASPPTTHALYVNVATSSHDKGELVNSTPSTSSTASPTNAVYVNMPTNLSEQISLQSAAHDGETSKSISPPNAQSSSNSPRNKPADDAPRSDCKSAATSAYAMANSVPVGEGKRDSKKGMRHGAQQRTAPPTYFDVMQKKCVYDVTV